MFFFFFFENVRFSGFRNFSFGWHAPDGCASGQAAVFWTLPFQALPSYCFGHGKILKYSSNMHWRCSTVSGTDCLNDIDASEKFRLKYLNNLDGLPWNNKTSRVSTILMWSSHWPLAQCWNLLTWSELLSNHRMDLDVKLSFLFRWITFIGKHFCLCNSCNTNGEIFRCILKISR